MKKYILLIFFLCLFTGAGYAQKKCTYDTKGPEEVPFIWMTNELDGGTLSFLRGKVTDVNGAAVSNARVSLTKVLKDKEDVFIGSQQVDKDGEYCFGTLAPGKYKLSAGAESFQKMVFIIKIVSKNDRTGRRKLNIKLEVGA